MGSPQPPSLCPLEFLTLSSVYSDPPAILQCSFGFPALAVAPMVVSSQDSLLWWVRATCICLSVSMCSLAVSGFASALPFLMEPRRVVGFSVCSDFYLLWWSGDFQVSYMWNQTLDEGRFIFFFSFGFIHVIFSWVHCASLYSLRNLSISFEFSELSAWSCS